MMKRSNTAYVAVLAAVVTLTGCASEPEAPAAVTPAAPTNGQACEDFAGVTVDLANVMVAGSGDMRKATDGMLERMDEAYLSAHGEVGLRIQKVMDELPEKGMYMLYLDSADYTANVKAVSRACEDEGFTTEMSIWE